MLCYPDNRFVGAGHLLDAGEQLTATVASQNREQGTFRHGSSNFNYRHQFREKGPELTASLDYLAYHTTTDQTFATITTSPAGIVTAQDYLIGQLPAAIRIYAAKADYSHPLAVGRRVEAGAKASYITTDNVADYFNATAAPPTPDYDKTNHFQYQEGLNAAYLNVNKDWARLSLQAGLRLEQTLSQGHQLGNPLKT
ncbi:MAG: outer membrane beta-barrel protein [Janthinobacterium lividum]